jgi:hypothetical protein
MLKYHILTTDLHSDLLTNFKTLNIQLILKEK